MAVAPIGIHAKPGDVLVGRLTEPIGMYRDEVYLRDLSPELRQRLAALDALVAAVEKAQRTCNWHDCGGDCGCSDIEAALMAAERFAEAHR